MENISSTHENDRILIGFFLVALSSVFLHLQKLSEAFFLTSSLGLAKILWGEPVKQYLSNYQCIGTFDSPRFSSLFFRKCGYKFGAGFCGIFCHFKIPQDVRMVTSLN